MSNVNVYPITVRYKKLLNQRVISVIIKEDNFAYLLQEVRRPRYYWEISENN